ncbi:MAG: hypothetical protein EHM20_14775 [Alphaproteobacteria bacterium]|nr:MAG: hypothetical protein EHM20_14775 [Alphaproteobacteria bacterium]
MKITLAIIVALMSFTTFAGTQTDSNLNGIFKDSYPISSHGYADEKACLADGGIHFEEGACWFNDGGAHVEIKKNENENEKFDLTVSVVGTNMHMCDYQAEAVQVNQTQLLSKDGECEVTVNFTSKDSISVVTNGQCRDFCGANMELDVAVATREK